jgi:hypothetical protein
MQLKNKKRVSPVRENSLSKKLTLIISNNLDFVQQEVEIC